MCKYLTTGFRTLDDMLGGNGVRRGSTVIIRGGPGTGKTTMVYQIIHHAIMKENHHVVFASFEESSMGALDLIADSYFKTTAKEHLGNLKDKLITLDGPAVILKTGNHVAKIIGKDFFTNSKYADGLEDYENASVHERRQFLTAFAKELPLSALLGDLWKHFLSKGFLPSKPTLVVIDSLTALVGVLNEYFRNYTERECFRLILRSLRVWRQEYQGNLTVLLTSEISTQLIQESPTADSYVADVVIKLQREKQSREVVHKDRESSKWVEELASCRVEKARGLASQRRWSTYEFVAEKGIVFFPTYGAEGIVSLFYENAPQLAAVDTMRTVDVPFLYPGVIVSSFERSALQKASAIRRYADRIPPRHPLVLSNVDEYWLADLREKQLLEEIRASDISLYAAKANSHQAEIIRELEAKVIHDNSPLYRTQENNFWAVPHFGNFGILVFRSEFPCPKTWEEVEETCMRYKSDSGVKFPLIIETQTYDSLFATVLELGWSHGAYWRTESRQDGTRRLSFENDVQGVNALVDAMDRLRSWVHVKQIVSPKSTMHSAKNSSQSKWLYARHWYSTWIDELTKIEGSVITDDGFHVAVIPTIRSREHKALHHSCWGEWYLAIQSDSENVELGTEIINNLMTSRKIVERALSGAGLPLQEQFYTDYGASVCPGTRLSFDELRRTFVSGARSRAKFFEYRTVSRILSGVVHAVIENSELSKSDVQSQVFQALCSIDSNFDPATGKSDGDD